MPAFLRIKLSGVLWFFGILLTGMVSGALTAVGGTKAVAVIAGAAPVDPGELAPPPQEPPTG
jgi:hypothetical protein